MKLSIIGSGYVGLVAGTCFADSGNDVICVDIDRAKIERLEKGEVPIYEPGLEELVERNLREGRLRFSTDLKASVAMSEVVFIAVGTPEGETGEADLKYVLAAAQQIGEAISRYTIIVDKSTVPVGTAEKVRAEIAKNAKHPFDVVSNPEFLKEGAAIDDFFRPDRVVIGVDSERARKVMTQLYAPFVRTENPILFMDTLSAELTKYAANAMLATRISFMNDIAILCERVGADVDQVRKGLGSDKRIGYPFLFPGVGYGGSCLDGNESVLVKQVGRTRLVSLRTLFGELAPEASDEPRALAVQPRDLEVLSWEASSSQPRFLPVAAATRRFFEGQQLEVRTKMGRRVKCTPDHPFVVSDENGRTPTTRLAEQLTTQDWLPVVSGPPESTARAEPTRFDLLSGMAHAGLDDEHVIVRLTETERGRLELPEIRQKLESMHPRGRGRWEDIRRTGTLRLDEAKASGLLVERARFGSVKNGTYAPGELVADEAFWRVVGLYLAEGCCSADGRRRRLMWSFHPHREMDLVDEVADFWRKLGVKVDVFYKQTSAQVTVSSRLLAGFWLGELGLGEDCYRHRLPDSIWQQSEANQRALLSGLWAGDGSWSYVAGGPSVVLEYGTVSHALADGMLRLLGHLGITARLKIGRVSKSTVDTHWLTISGAEQIEKVLWLVHPEERDQLRASLARQAKRIAPTGYRRLASNTSWVRVSEVNRRPFSGFVYSLEVPGASTFVTTGGLVVHNCFPKDVKALVTTAREHGIEFELLRAVERTNDRQKRLLVQKALKHFGGELAGKTFAVWGLAFKPRTDDMREAPSIEVIEGLIGKGAKVQAHDPVASTTARRVFGDRIVFADTPYGALEGADALFVVTEWNEFRQPDFDRIKSALKQPVIFDGRNIYDPANLRERGFVYYGIGRR